MRLFGLRFRVGRRTGDPATCYPPVVSTRSKASAPSRCGLAALAVASLALAILIAFVADPEEGAPPKHTLHEAVGAVAWSEGGRRSVRFGLSGTDLSFSYASKSGSHYFVKRQLSAAVRAPVRVLYERNDAQPRLWADRVNQRVYEIEVDGRLVRAWRDVDAATRRNNALAPWLVGVFTLSGMYLGFLALRTTDPADGERA